MKMQLLLKNNAQFEITKMMNVILWNTNLREFEIKCIIINMQFVMLYVTHKNILIFL